MTGRDARLSRRSFLVGAGGGAAALALAGYGARSWAGGAPTTTETVGGWLQPVSRASSGGELSTTLRASLGPALIGTEEARALTYEGMYPGPTLEVRPGDRLKIDLVNDTAQNTNLHTHGLHVSPKSPSDNVLLQIAPGDTFRYQYDIPQGHPAGTLWYHAHYHTLTDNQVFAGLFGGLLVRGPADDAIGVPPSGERVMIISQTQIVDGAVADADTSSLSAQSTLVNGRYQPSLEIAPGEIQRWRLFNASVVFLRLQLDGHVMHQVAFDGNTAVRPVPAKIVEIPPGGRVDVLVQGGRTGKAKLRSLTWDPFGVFYTSMVPVPQTLVRVVTRGKAVSPRPSLPAKLLGFEDLRKVKVDRRRTFRLEEMEPRGTGQNDKYRYYINGRVFDHDRVDETMVLGDVEEWTFVNKTYEPHPVHIHVNEFQVVARNGKPVSELHYRDTGILPPFGSLTIRHRFADYTGKFVWHCHILFHEDHGMMQQLEVVEDGKPSGTGLEGGASPASVGNLASAPTKDGLLCKLPLA